jgi:ABC-type sugar transport system substrate-binding protein
MAEQARVVEDVIAKGGHAIGIFCNDPTACEDPIPSLTVFQALCYTS